MSIEGRLGNSGTPCGLFKWPHSLPSREAGGDGGGWFPPNHALRRALDRGSQCTPTTEAAHQTSKQGQPPSGPPRVRGVEDLSIGLEAARAGAAIVQQAFGSAVEARFKGIVDPVTETDLAAEQAILAVIGSRRPADLVLAEEGGGSPDLAGRHWIVDPLDGTVNFLHGIPQVGVSVALYEDGEPQAAVVIDALTGEEFTATAVRPTELNGARVSVSTAPRLSEAVVATGFPYDRQQQGRQYAAILGAVLAEARGIRRLGSAALDLAWVAAGRFDAYWEFGLAPWDIAAGMLLVRQAGGLVTDHRGKYSTIHDSVFVTGGAQVHAELRRILTAEMPSGWPENR